MAETELKEQELFDRKMERLEREKKERDDQAAKIEQLEADLAKWKARSAENAGRANKAESQITELTAERDALEQYANNLMGQKIEAEAQLAVMRAALEGLDKWVWDMVGLFETDEDEAHDALKKPGLSGMEQGGWQAKKAYAKRMRRTLAEGVRECRAKEALATDAGKKAADVLKATQPYAAGYEKPMEEAVKAYRASQGSNDG